MEQAQVRNLTIIGSGPAGLTAAIYAARAGLQPLLIAGFQVGGQLMTTTAVENYPGFPEGIQGPELMERMLEQAKKWGTEFVYADVQSVDLAGEIKKVVANNQEYQSKAVIIATGATPRKLAIPGEDKYWGFGVSTCATCDGAFYKGKTVAVIGGGDTAMEEASFLTNHATKVYIIHRREEFRASKVMADKVTSNPKVEVIWNTEVREIVGDNQKVTKLALFNNTTNEMSELPVDGMFLAIGHIPVTGLFGGITLDQQGYVESIDGIRTNIEGVFVAGDVEDSEFRQAVTAAGMGCAAALTAQKWLTMQG